MDGDLPMTMIQGNFSEVMWLGLYRWFNGDSFPEWKPDPVELAKAEAERAADPEGYDRLTEGMMPRIPR